MNKRFISVFFVFLFISINSAWAAKAPPAKLPPPPLLKDSKTGMQLIYVKGGCYKMGDTFGDGAPEEKPAHEVCLNDFYIGKYEVTKGEWNAVMGSEDGSKVNFPMNNISWNDAQKFISKLNSESGGAKYRLPTEAEWEYAARSGGKQEKYSGGNDMHEVAWNAANSHKTSHPVGTKAPNGLGIYDMSGNLWEWTSDWYGSSFYSVSSPKKPTGPVSGDRRVLRGGSFGVGDFDVRTTYRNYLPPDYRGNAVGFRILKAM